MKKDKFDKLDLISLEIKEYNKKNNTNYNYGQHTALVRDCKIISDVMSGKGKKNENKEVL